MAQFDVYRLPDGTLVVDCQSDLVDDFATRLTVPLISPGDLNRPLPPLLPVFTIDGEDYIMATPFAAAVPKAALGKAVADLSRHAYAVTGAFDVLLTGY